MGMPAAAIQPGSRVTMHFSITLQDGTIADSTFDNEPIEFVVGDGTLIVGLERAIYGLKVHESESITLDPNEAYGFPEQDKIYRMARSEFKSTMELKPGLIIGFTTPSGEEIAGTVLKVFKDEVEMDLNHPLAGREILFKVKILSVVNPDL